MTISIKTAEEIEILREGGRRLCEILNSVAKMVASGVRARELNRLAEDLIKEQGDSSAFLNYKPAGAKRPFPAVLCVSVNDEVVHGIPNEAEKIFKEGDLVSLDMGLVHKGMITDMAVTVGVGQIDETAKKLLRVTEEALEAGIREAREGKRVGDISYAIESFIKSEAPEFGIIEELAGHGVGYGVHEEPYVPNFGKKNKGPLLKPGMVLAIEPMVNEGSKRVFLDKDGYTYRTLDGKRSVHFEKTIVIRENKAEIITDL